MKNAGIIALAAGCVLIIATAVTVQSRVHAAAEALKTGAATKKQAKVAIANDAEAKYCTPAFKTVLERVLHACGLVGQESRRGCQPADVKTLASINDEDFNALFTPLRDRGAVIMFDDGSEKLDDTAKKMIEELWQDRRGARYFFVVARASKTGTPEFNRALSHKRANSVLFLLSDKFKDPELEKQVGLLWLGNEYAQLKPEYCEWNVSRDKKKCSGEAINRSAFVSWVDCQL
jgi:outer membrane protein OmpA-like peptidoglycan-associated protein